MNGGSTRLNIALVTAPAGVGGLETVVAGLALGLARRGNRVVLHALVEPAPAALPAVFDPLPAAGVTVDVVRLPPRRYRAEAERLRDAWGQQRPAVVHSHGYHADCVAWWAARRLNLPLVSTSHGFTGGDLKNRLYERIDGWVLRRFDRVVAVSRPLGDRLLASGLTTDRMVVILNGRASAGESADRAGARRRLGLPDRGRVAGWIGRLSLEKGADVLIDALEHLPSDLHLSFVGDGPLQAPLERRVLDRGWESRVHWHGRIEGINRLLAAFDLVVLSSRTEGTPMVLLEAMGAGVPVVATAVGGVPDVVSPEEARLVPSERPDLLAAAMVDVFEHPAAAARRADAARARVESEFSEARWLDAYEALYRRAACR